MDLSSPLVQYAVAESKNAICLVPAGTAFSSAVNRLVIGPLPSCVRYLSRYLDARGRGFKPYDAHGYALSGATVLDVIERPGT
jgi:hypothetical protein